MRLSQLNTYVKVIKHQSISKAGEELFLTQIYISSENAQVSAFHELIIAKEVMSEKR